MAHISLDKVSLVFEVARPGGALGNFVRRSILRRKPAEPMKVHCC